MNALVAISDAPAKRHYWTTREERVIRENFPAGGVPACLPLLPGRSETSIYQHASRMGLKSTKHCGVRQRWTTTPFIDEAIRRAYQSEAINTGVITRLAQTLGRPGWWVKKRGAALGLVTPRFKELPWTESELEIVRANAHKQAARIRLALKRAGYLRTETAIIVKLKRLGCDRTDYDHFTATALAGLFGVDSKVITGWIAKGWLTAKRRGTERTEAQGGDQWWISRGAIRRFVVENVAAVDLRKVDKFWFVDLLAETGSREAGSEAA